VNATDVIFGLVYREPRVDDLEEEETREWPVEMYLQLRDVLRDQVLVRMGLDPREYSFATDEIPWGPYGGGSDDEWAVDLEDANPLADTSRFPGAALGADRFCVGQ
jgi:hypothetical protein